MKFSINNFFIFCAEKCLFLSISVLHGKIGLHILRAYNLTWHYARLGEKFRSLEDWQLMSLFKNILDSKITKTLLGKIKGQLDLRYLKSILQSALLNQPSLKHYIRFDINDSKVLEFKNHIHRT